MGFIALLTATAIGAIIIAVLFTTNSNYLDPNINTSLDLTKKLELKGTFTAEDRKANNAILRKKLNIFEKGFIILDEMEQRRSKNTLTPSAVSAPIVPSQSV